MKEDKDAFKVARLEIIDSMLRMGRPVSFGEIASAFADRLPKEFRNEYALSFDEAYGANFRRDMKEIAAILDEINNREMLIVEGQNSKRRYMYADTTFSITPYIPLRYTNNSINSINKALRYLRNVLSERECGEIEFAVRSRIESEFKVGITKRIDYGENIDLRGRYWLPIIYRSLDKKVLTINYKSFRGDVYTFNLHPYYLRQYSGRWYVFGYCNNNGRDVWHWRVPLDRIQSIEVCKDEPLRRIKEYETLFNEPYTDVINEYIGISKRDAYGKEDESMSKTTVQICFHSSSAWQRTKTKPIHHSQHVIQELDEEKGLPGKITIDVIPNIEMYMTILSLGEDVEVETPLVREGILHILDGIAKGYGRHLVPEKG